MMTKKTFATMIVPSMASQLEPNRAVGVEEAEAVGTAAVTRATSTAERGLVADHSAERVVHEPRCGEQCERDRDGGPLGHVGADEVEIGVDVEDAEEREAGEPRRVRLPLEPLQSPGRVFGATVNFCTR